MAFAQPLMAHVICNHPPLMLFVVGQRAVMGIFLDYLLNVFYKEKQEYKREPTNILKAFLCAIGRRTCRHVVGDIQTWKTSHWHRLELDTAIAFLCCS